MLSQAQAVAGFTYLEANERAECFSRQAAKNAKERHRPGLPESSPHLMPLRHRMLPLTCRLNSFFAISAPLREGVL